jgi:transcriptional regulator with XRE-family HTH domain
MTNDQSQSGVSLRDARKQAGFTQVELSVATGIDQASISRMETGKQGNTLTYLQRIAAALDVPISDLVGVPERH